MKLSVDLVARALKNAISDTRGRWVLGPHAEARSEHRIRLSANGLMSTYVMDRIFRTVDGERWVVDYKTSRHEGSETTIFLNQETERYRHQLISYRRAVNATSAGLYFPLLQGWRELKS